MTVLSLTQMKRRRKRVAERLRTLRIDAGLTIDRMAAACGVTRFTWMRWESGDYSVPLEVLPTLTAHLGCRLEQIVPDDKPAKAA